MSRWWILVGLALVAGVALAQPPGDTAPQPTPHAPTLAMRKKTAHGGFVADMDCSACHTEDGWQLAKQAGASGFDHDRTGFPLRGAHVQTQCTGCHTGKAKPATSCEGCHRDVHQGRNNGPCAECHLATTWSDTETLEQHRRTRLPLTGRHATVDCAACHKRQAERVFSDTPSDCFACHSAQYHDPNVHPRHDGTIAGCPPLPRDCAQCHPTTTFSQAFGVPSSLQTMCASARLAPGEHDAMFVLSTGSHRTADCTACHPDQRRAKLVRCDGCHQTTALRAQHRAPVANVASACLACHPRGAAR